MTMDYNREKVDEIVLALLALTMFKEKNCVRAWKSHDWDTMDRLHAKGYIADPRSQAKSVTVTAHGELLAKQLFKQHFGGIA